MRYIILSAALLLALPAAAQGVLGFGPIAVGPFPGERPVKPARQVEPAPADGPVCDSTGCQTVVDGYRVQATAFERIDAEDVLAARERAVERAGQTHDDPPFEPFVPGEGCRWVRDVQVTGHQYHGDRRLEGGEAGAPVSFSPAAEMDLTARGSGDFDLHLERGGATLLTAVGVLSTGLPLRYVSQLASARLTGGRDVVVLPTTEVSRWETATIEVVEFTRTLVCDGEPVLSESRKEVTERFQDARNTWIHALVHTESEPGTWDVDAELDLAWSNETLRERVLVGDPTVDDLADFFESVR